MARSNAARSTNGTRRKSSNGAIRTYRSALKFLNSVTDHEKMSRVGYTSANYNLTRVGKLLTALGKPHKKLRSVHIAGTKGKGSTAAMLAHMLENCGYKVGLYTSPHLIDLRERITIDGEMITGAELTKIVAKIAPVVRKMKAPGPTFFEILTCVAFAHFVDKEIDIAIVETGLGGRLDSTNVLKPEVCGMTSISYDHMPQLGTTLDAITEEKAGILKAGVPVVSAPQPLEVKERLKKVAAKMGAPLHFAGEDLAFSYRFESSRAAGPHTRVSLTTPDSRFEHLPVPLLGEHQAINCGVALGLVDALKGRGFEIDDQKAIEGLTHVKLSGRMEILAEDPRILADGAHNAASIEALMRAIGQNIPYDSMVVIFGCQADKDIPGMLDFVQIGADKVIFTSAGLQRSADPKELAGLYAERTHKMWQVTDTLEEALDIARRAVSREDLICVTGSFYLVGALKRLLAS